MTAITLIRHGETKANVEGLFHGITNTRLTQRGLAQAERVAHRLSETHERASAIYSSPLDRAVQTAEVVAGRLSMALRIDPSLQEIDLGEWEGLPFHQLDTEHRLLENLRSDPDYAPHGGESLRQVADRATGAIRRIVEDHPSEQIVLISHGGALCCALASLLGTAPLVGEEYYMENCAVTELVFEPQPCMTLHNCCAHLGGV
jgi:probable phosphoglycerate mutase